MGHTVPAKRQIIYSKLAELEKFAHSLRKPYRERLLQLLKGAHFNVSAMVYTNSLNDEEAVLMGILAEQMREGSFADAEKVQRCLAILLSNE